MAKYSKEKLLDDFKRDLINYLNLPSNIYIKIEVTSNHLTFYFNPLAESINSIESKLSNLSLRWSKRIFKGINGYYIFGDILKDTIVELNNNLIRVSIPFHKIDYESYLDLLPNELNTLILNKINNYEEAVS